MTKAAQLAGHNCMLRDLGDGFAMFDSAGNALDCAMERQRRIKCKQSHYF